jgi:hypothetical protein
VYIAQYRRVWVAINDLYWNFHVETYIVVTVEERGSEWKMTHMCTMTSWQ